MGKTFKKVIYSDYKDKYDDTIKTQLKTSPESKDVETMRANLYGYTFTKEYAEGKIPDELSMDYWEEQRLKNDPLDTIISSNNPEFFTPDGMIKDYCLVHCDIIKVRWLQESTSFGGHSIPKGGHRRVSGLVRASVKEEVRKQIESELNG